MIGGLTCLLLPETTDRGFTSSIDDAENFYRKSMKFTASLLKKTDEVYHRSVMQLINSNLPFNVVHNRDIEFVLVSRRATEKSADTNSTMMKKK